MNLLRSFGAILWPGISAARSFSSFFAIGRKNAPYITTVASSYGFSAYYVRFKNKADEINVIRVYNEFDGNVNNVEDTLIMKIRCSLDTGDNPIKYDHDLVIRLENNWAL